MNQSALLVDMEIVPEEITERIYISGAFGQSQKQKSLFRYLLAETMQGRGNDLKPKKIAIDVFQRDETYDPSIDSLVRVEMYRLRRNLNLYFSTAGKNEPVSIKFLPGQYTPTLTENHSETDTNRPQIDQHLLGSLSSRLASPMPTSVLPGYYWMYKSSLHSSDGDPIVFRSICKIGRNQKYKHLSYLINNNISPYRKASTKKHEGICGGYRAMLRIIYDEPINTGGVSLMYLAPTSPLEQYALEGVALMLIESSQQFPAARNVFLEYAGPEEVPPALSMIKKRLGFFKIDDPSMTKEIQDKIINLHTLYWPNPEFPYVVS